MHLRFRSLAATFLLLLPLTGGAQTTEYGTIDIVQNDANNSATSVTLTTSGGSSSNFALAGGNRGDFNLDFGPVIDPSVGVLITCVSELSRDNTAKGDTIGAFYATASFGPDDGLADYYVALSSSPAGAEVNMNVAFGFFPYGKWTAGVARNVANNGELTLLTGSPSLSLGTHFVDGASPGGQYSLNINSVTGNNAAQNGVLLVAGARNEDNYALSRANADGSFSLFCHDNGSNGASYENDGVGFVYLPTNKVGTERLVAIGRVNGDGTTDVSASIPGHGITVTKGGTGTWYLQIAGESRATGTLIISPEGGAGNNVDNIVSYVWDDANSRWIIESRDVVTTGTSLPLEDMAAADDVFSFAFFAAPQVALTSPTAGAVAVAGASIELTATAADPGGTVTQVEFLRNGEVIGTDASEPFAFTDTNVPAGHHNYRVRATYGQGDTASSAVTLVTVTLDPANLPSNTALSFDGLNDYVTMGAAPTLNVGQLSDAGFTLECWFRKEGAGVAAGSGSGGVTAVPLFGKGRGESDGSNVDCNIFFGITGAGVLVADFEAQPATGISAGLNFPFTATHSPITSNAWHHAAVTYDHATSTWSMYLDGVNVGSTTVTAGARPRYDSIQHFGIGTALNSTGVREGAFRGRIDEARVWNYARTAAEVVAAKDQQIAAAAGMVGRYGLNEGTGTTAANSSGVSPGTLTEGPVWVDGAPFGTPNTPPTVALVQPVNNSNSIVAEAVTFEATASDAEGQVTRVEFLVDGVEVGEDTSAPFTHNWTSPAEGDYVIQARAFDVTGISSVSAVATLHVLPSPHQPNISLAGPAEGAAVSGSSVMVQANVSDPDGDATAVTFYGRHTTPVVPGPDFSIVQLPDTQYYSEGAPGHANTISVEELVAIFGRQTQWVVENRTARNIAFVSHMGDIVQSGNNSGNNIEWVRASSAMGRLENPATTLRAHGIPYGLAPGNHDIDPIGNYDGGSTAFYNEFFGLNRFAGRTYWGGNYGSDNTNNYQLFSISGLDFIAIHFAYDTTPNQAILDWADALLKAHPHRRAIITSHSIIGAGNPASFSAQGQGIYNALKDNPNVFLMLCGHIHAEGRRTDVFEGRKVYSILSDYQGAANGGNGFLRMLKFSPANNAIVLESYSPTLDRAVDASDGIPSWETTVNLPYNMQDPIMDWVPLGTVSVPAGGTSASLNWTGLESGKNYEWYAVATDGVHTGSSTPRRFTTDAQTAPTVTLDTPAAGATFSTPVTVTFNATAADADGSVSRVEFYSDGVKLGEDTAAPYTFQWVGVPAGAYTVSAVAVDDSNLATLSNTAAILVNPGDFPPTVALTAPAEDATLASPANVTLVASATDVEGPVSKVEFYSGTTTLTLLGEDTTAPFTLDLTSLAPGGYTFTAKATDSVGQTTTSVPVNISVFVEAPVPGVSNVTVGSFDAPAWTMVRTSPSPRQFSQAGSDNGDLEVKINDASVPFNSGITLATNWNGAASRDNLCQPYANASGNVFVSILDNSNNNAAGANPSTSEETSGVNVGFLPYASNWTGASVNGASTVLHSNLPAGVTVTKSFAAGLYTINGLSVAGNLLAFPNGDSGTLADNICSVRIEGGRWMVNLRDNAGGGQDNDFSFVYIPPNATGVYAAAVSSTGAVSHMNAALTSLGATATPTANGIDITFGDGTVINPDTAALFVTLESSSGQGDPAADNLVSWTANGNSFRVFSQDLPEVNGTHEAVELRILAVPFIPAVPVNEVIIAATDGAAGEHGADQAINFVISRTGSTSLPLTVPLAAAGSATSGADYTGFLSSVTIPASETSVSLPLIVLSDTLAEGSEVVQINLQVSPDFAMGSPGTATATIADQPSQDWYVNLISDPAKRGALDDADQDGVSNLMEYFMGTHPGEGGSSAPTIVTSDGEIATFWFNRALNRDDVTATVEWSTDLVNWFTGGQSNGERTVNIQITTGSQPADDPQVMRGVATDGSGGPLPSGLFFRLKVAD